MLKDIEFKTKGKDFDVEKFSFLNIKNVEKAKNLSPESKDLLKKILVFVPAMRIDYVTLF